MYSKICLKPKNLVDCMLSVLLLYVINQQLSAPLLDKTDNFVNADNKGLKFFFSFSFSTYVTYKIGMECLKALRGGGWSQFSIFLS